MDIMSLMINLKVVKVLTHMHRVTLDLQTSFQQSLMECSLSYELEENKFKREYKRTEIGKQLESKRTKNIECT